MRTVTYANSSIQHHLSILWSVIHAFTMISTFCGSCRGGGGGGVVSRQSQRLASMQKAFSKHPLLWERQWLTTHSSCSRGCCSERLHHPLVESKCVVPDYEIRYGPFVTWQRFLLWDIDGVGRTASRKEHNRMVPRKVEELGPSIGRTPYANVLAIQGT